MLHCPKPSYYSMPYSESPYLLKHITLTAAIAIVVILTCTACGCLSFPWTDEGTGYQPPTFEPTPLPTIHPTHIPTPTMVCDPPANQTTTADWGLVSSPAGSS